MSEDVIESEEQEIYQDIKRTKEIAYINTWFKVILISAITGTVLYKIITSSFDLFTFDFSDLLSLILAIFSIFLSVMFYIKADETSNRFYDNTQKFTQNVSEILGRIESGFGERLRHMDEGYSKLEDFYINNSSKRESSNEIEKNEIQVRTFKSEQDALIKKLLTSSNLDRQEKENIQQRLDETNSELENARSIIDQLRNEQRINELDPDKISLKRRANAYLKRMYPGYPEMKKNRYSLIALQNVFKKYLEDTNSQWIADLHKLGYVDSTLNLTEEGFEFIRRSID
jgi:hypothetical protein